MSHYLGVSSPKHDKEGFSLKKRTADSSSHLPPRQARSPYPASSISRQLSPRSRFGGVPFSLNPKPSSNDFFGIIVDQMRRIDANFTIEWTEETPLQQALNCLIQAIDCFENATSQTPNLYMPSLSQNYYQQSDEITLLEEKLKNKEEKLKHDEQVISKEKQSIAHDKEKIKKIKEHYLELENELAAQKKKLDLREKEESSQRNELKKALEREAQRIEEERSRLETEKREIEMIKSKLEEFGNSISAEHEELEQERSNLYEKTLELEREKWKIDSEKAILEEKNAINSHIKEKIDQELQIIESERANLLKLKIDYHSDSLKYSEQFKQIDQEKLSVLEMQNSLLSEKLSLAEQREKLTFEEERIAQILTEIQEEKQSLLQARYEIENDKKAVIEERQAVNEAWDEIEENGGGQTGMRRPRNEEDYSSMLEELQQQMVNYNKEVEIRERDYELKCSMLAQREEEIDQKLAEIQAAEFNLIRARHDLEELSLGTIPELENSSQNIQKIMADLLIKRNEVDNGYNQLQAKIEEFEKNKANYRGNKEIARLADELEEKLGKIKQREDELTLLEGVLEKEKKENLANAIYLQKAQKEFESSTLRKENEIADAKKRLENLQKKLENAISIMNSKENDLINLKEMILDEKSRLTSPDIPSNKSGTPINE